MKKNILIAVCVCILIACAFAVGSNAANGDSNKINSVLINKDLTAIEIKGNLTSDYVSAHKNDRIYLFEIFPYQSTSRLHELKPAADVKVSASFSFKLEFKKDNKTKLYAKYLVAEKNPDGNFTLITSARFIDNPEIAAAEKYAYPTYASKKGLKIQMDTDAQELGVSHTVINVPINEYMLVESGSNSEPYLYDNKSYFISKRELENLDKKIKVYTDAGIEVYLNIILTPVKDNTPEQLKCLYYGNIDPYVKLYAFNIQNQESVQYMQSFMTFLAERYTREDRLYGFAGSFIFGYQVNSNRAWNNMGPMSLDSYLNQYVTAFRIADTALRSVYSNGRVYVSVANNFNHSSGSADIIADPELDYSGRALLEAFNKKIADAGNIPWYLAINVYASELRNSEIWNDDGALDDYAVTPYITMKNIGALCDFLTQETFKYNTRVRNILISEFGVHSGIDESNASAQAASIAYGFFKAQTYPMIDAIIYHRHVDHPSENERFGLWMNQNNIDNAPFGKKTAYNVFKYMDTTDAMSQTAFALSQIGIKEWTDAIPGFKEANVAKRKIFTASPVLKQDIGRGIKDKLLFDFSEGSFNNFFESDNSNYLQLRQDTVSDKSMLYTSLQAQYAGEYMGISCIGSKRFNFKNVQYITFKVKVDAPVSVTSLNIMLRLYNVGDATNGNAVYESVSTVTTGRWDEVTFAVSAMTDVFSNIDGMKLWIKPTDNLKHDGTYGLWLDEVTLHSKNSGLLDAFLWGLLILFIAFVLFVIYVIIRNLIVIQRRKRRRAAHQARIQQMRQQQNNQQPRRRPPPDNKF
ncbi:MAG: DUF5722 domain-containing protein [Oscillospiraceae bacterium]|nr:DUF5722 domain-containing protein [Oscillospiraceae bacterium]